jgi:K+-sensing histidine kinase KdpD
VPFATGSTRRLLQVGSFALLVLLGWLDYVTGYEFGFFIFYFIPVSIAAWWGGRGPGLLMGCLSAIAWFVADRLTNHTYRHAYLVYWETFMRLASFITTALTLSKIRETVDARQRLQAELERAQEENAALKQQLGPRRECE